MVVFMRSADFFLVLTSMHHRFNSQRRKWHLLRTFINYHAGFNNSIHSTAGSFESYSQ